MHACHALVTFTLLYVTLFITTHFTCVISSLMSCQLNFCQSDAKPNYRDLVRYVFPVLTHLLRCSWFRVCACVCVAGRGRARARGLQNVTVDISGLVCHVQQSQIGKYFTDNLYFILINLAPVSVATEPQTFENVTTLESTFEPLLMGTIQRKSWVSPLRCPGQSQTVEGWRYTGIRIEPAFRIGALSCLCL